MPVEVLNAGRAWMQAQKGFDQIALRTVMARRMPTWTRLALIDTAALLLIRAEQKAGRVNWDTYARVYRPARCA